MSEVDLSVCVPGDECFRDDGNVVRFDGRARVVTHVFKAGGISYRQDGTVLYKETGAGKNIVRVERAGQVITPALSPPAPPAASQGDGGEELPDFWFVEHTPCFPCAYWLRSRRVVDNATGNYYRTAEEAWSIADKRNAAMIDLIRRKAPAAPDGGVDDPRAESNWRLSEEWAVANGAQASNACAGLPRTKEKNWAYYDWKMPGPNNSLRLKFYYKHGQYEWDHNGVIKQEPQTRGAALEFLYSVGAYISRPAAPDLAPAQGTGPVKPLVAGCGCTTCLRANPDDQRGRLMILCPTCGNKRCPKATYHGNACTGSNAPGQKGSSWESVKPAAPASPANEDPKPITGPVADPPETPVLTAENLVREFWDLATQMNLRFVPRGHWLEKRFIELAEQAELVAQVNAAGAGKVGG